MTLLQNNGRQVADPVLSVCVVTHNQRPFVRRCLESLLQQECEFPWEIIVGDDASTDGTSDVVRELAEAHPGRFVAFFQEDNLGAVANYRLTHRAARGRYVAHVDGDDYVLPGKLAKQVSVLECESNTSAVFHKLEMVSSEGARLGRCWPESAPRRFDLEYLVLNHPIVGHSAMMYRRGAIDQLLGGQEPFIDFRVYVELASAGEIVVIPEVLGGYTVGVGISSSNKWLRHVLASVDAAEKYGVSAEIVHKARAKHLFRAALNEFYSGSPEKFLRLAEESAEIRVTSLTHWYFYRFRHFPRLLKLTDRAYKLARKLGIVADWKMAMR